MAKGIKKKARYLTEKEVMKLEGRSMDFKDDPKGSLTIEENGKKFTYSKHGLIIFDEDGRRVRSMSPREMRGNLKEDIYGNEEEGFPGSGKLGLRRIPMTDKDKHWEVPDRSKFDQFKDVLQKLEKYGAICGKIPVEVTEAIFGSNADSYEECYIVNLRLMDDHEERQRKRQEDLEKMSQKTPDT